jgi:hypothetical protein
VMLFEAEPDMSSSDNVPDLHREHSHTWGSLVPPNRRPMQDFSEKCLVTCMYEYEYVHVCAFMYACACM